MLVVAGRRPVAWPVVNTAASATAAVVQVVLETEYIDMLNPP
jgi:hypothetical protein